MRNQLIYRTVLILGAISFAWNVSAQVTIVVTSLPETSPDNLRIYITGNFNDWQSNLPQYELTKNQEGNYQIVLDKYLDPVLEFKFTAGDWDHIESDHNYLPRPNRILDASKTQYYEAIIENWQEVNRGSGANIYLFTVLAAISLSVVLLWLTNRYVKKFTLQKLLFPLGLSVSSILLGLFFLKLNTFQWIPILNLLKWVGLVLVVGCLWIINRRKEKLNQLFLPVFFSATIALVFVAASSSFRSIPVLAGFHLYSSIIIIQVAFFLLGFLQLDITIKGKVPIDNSTDLLLKEFQRMIKEEKVYLDPELTVESLATKMGIHRNLLSKIINETYETRFTDYINQHRVREYIQLAKESGVIEKYTFFGLAQKVGFNSKSAFFRTFKGITGKTPKEYFQEVT